MTSVTNPPNALTSFPDHTQLPDSDGTFVFAERAEQESQRAEQESQRADRLAAQLRSLGIEPET
ncbi:hypothetical protein [Nostoc sp.]|uniref:hypothetical protein n=1 Tax=Nostoc sp. TaxID=1180 RepID=UPI002FFC0F80